MRLLRQFQTRLLGRVATLAGAIVLSALVSVAMLPFTTRVLQASDYGTYAMLMSIVALVSAAMDGGAGILMPAHYSLASARERGRIFASLAVFGGLSASAAGLVLIGVWLWHDSAFVQGPGFLIIGVTAILMPIRALTTIAMISFSVVGRTAAIAALIACQALVVFGSTLIALFGFSLGGASLFVGAGCGQLAALAVCVGALIRSRELALPSGYWFRQAFVSAPTTAIAGFMDGARNFGESLMLSGAAGLHAVGILSHAKIYSGLLNTFASAVAQNVYCKSLEDARDPRSTFETTEKAWAPVQIVISCAAIVFVFFGRDIVELISNGKLTDASDYIPVLFMIALIQNSEQPAAAVVFASGRGSSATWFRSFLFLTALILLYPVVLFAGIKGILILGIIECCIFRGYLRLLASGDRRVPFQDQISAFGCLIITVAMIVQHVAAPHLPAQLILIGVGIAMIAAVGQRSVGQTIGVVREMLALLSSRRQVG